MAGAAGMAGNGGGSGGSSGGGSAGGSSGGGSAGGSSGGGSAGGACPADKTFCAGFEDAMLPTGAIYKVNAAPGEWTRDFEIDTTVAKSGKSSLKLKSPSGSGSAYQMLAVPAPPGEKFWARFYIRQAATDIGIVDHNVFAGASDTSEPNGSVMIEFAEDVGVSLNTSDDVRWPAGFGRIGGDVKPFTLAKGEWHCIEISYDGKARAQQVYVNGVLKIDAMDYPKTVAKPLAFFKFGFNSLHGPHRSVWYDDVAVSSTRPGCL
jgi:hypothetical protein